MSFQISLDINRPSDTVFAFIADFRTMPRWYEAVTQVTALTPAFSGNGARFRTVRSLPGGPAHNEVEVTTHIPGEQVTFASTSGPTPFRYHYRVEPTAAGTRLTLEAQISGTGLPHPLSGIAEHLFKQGMKKNLHTLRRILESTP
ncbi:hypothetical protein GCM10023195_33670 [Actinoallomurus liliacearum]|uniref:Polyketide cyclase n=1 Tax=Actinoallomurus liliacearum TaxID=1080073 RepID=A0ABP8TN07_9ACTN